MNRSNDQEPSGARVPWSIRLPCVIASAVVFGAIVMWMRQVPWTSEEGSGYFLLYLFFIALHNFFFYNIVFNGRLPFWLDYLRQQYDR